MCCVVSAWNSYTNEMIGDHCSVLITDAYLKGLLPVAEADGSTAFAEKAYSVMRRNAMEIPPMKEIMQGKGRRGIQSYLENGFLPLDNPVPFAFHDGEQVSRTLEYAYDDYVLAQMAGLLGHAADRDYLLDRSEAYRFVIDADGK
jgi:putative alpha-1,2-mannosidase